MRLFTTSRSLSRATAAIALFAGALFLAACGTSRPATVGRSEDVSEAAEADAAPDAHSDLEALYWARQDSARMDFTEADVKFMTGMIKHHAQALVMSHMAPENGASPQVQTLASRIINAQQDEIASMQQWLRRRNQSVPEVEMEGTRLRVGGMPVHGMNMVGVLTEAQIQALSEARGDAFDRLFLEYMIQHHSGAVTMVDRLFEANGAAQDDAAFKLASDIHVDQETEIARMKQMLGRITSSSGTAAPSGSRP